jgi:hypothetical protein
VVGQVDFFGRLNVLTLSARPARGKEGVAVRLNMQNYHTNAVIDVPTPHGTNQSLVSSRNHKA